MRNGGVIVDRTIAFLEERNGKGEGNLSNFWQGKYELVDESITRWNTILFSLSIYFFIAQRDIFLEGKILPSEVTIYSHWSILFSRKYFH